MRVYIERLTPSVLPALQDKLAALKGAQGGPEELLEGKLRYWAVRPTRSYSCS
jgi:hypothetical protein